jgi:hypothetical protein
MKARPRRVEREIAKYISEMFLKELDLPSVQRIPVLGREGPDMEIWPFFNVAADVKSRKSNPVGYKLEPDEIGNWYKTGLPHVEHVGVRLESMHLLFGIENMPVRDRRPSKTVYGWLCHMRDWCEEEEGFSIPAIILHWPQHPIKHSTVLIFREDRRYLDDRRKRINHLRLRTRNQHRDDGRPYWFEG